MTGPATTACVPDAPCTAARAPRKADSAGASPDSARDQQAMLAPRTPAPRSSSFTSQPASASASRPRKRRFASRYSGVSSRWRGRSSSAMLRTSSSLKVMQARMALRAIRAPSASKACKRAKARSRASSNSVKGAPWPGDLDPPRAGRCLPAYAVPQPRPSPVPSTSAKRMSGGRRATAHRRTSRCGARRCSRRARPCRGRARRWPAHSRGRRRRSGRRGQAWRRPRSVRHAARRWTAAAPPRPNAARPVPCRPAP